MHQEVMQHYDCMTVAEGPGTHIDNVLDLVAEDRQELNMNYHFDHQSIGVGDRFIINDDFQNLVKFKEVMSQWDAVFKDKGWGTVYFGNHDFARMVSRWGNDTPQYRRFSSKLLTTYLLSMRGTPYYYMGDEIGMTNIRFDNIEDYQDLMTINWYNLTKQEGGDLDEFMASHKLCARDNARTPIQWDNTANAGFTSGQPWLKVNSNYPDINVAAQQNELDSELNYFRSMVNLRNHNLTLIYGEYTLLLASDPDIYAYTRRLDDDVILVLLNFSANKRTVDIAELLGQQEFEARVLIDNYANHTVSEKLGSLRPYQAQVIQL
jgi:oligo-1,6-glucosidase